MTDEIPAEQLKNRILGAVILVAAAVLLIRMLLGDPKSIIPEEDAGQGAQRTTESTGDEFKSRISKEPASALSKPQVSVGRMSNTNQQNNQSSADETGNRPLTLEAKQTIEKHLLAEGEPLSSSNHSDESASDQPKLSKSDKAFVDEASVSKSVSEQVVTNNKEYHQGWALQVGIFTKPENTSSMVASLRAHGLSPRVSAYKTEDQAQASRIWFGPYDTKAEAMTASSLLEKKIGNDGYVSELPFKQ